MTWSGPAGTPRLRASADGVAWSEWVAAPLDSDVSDAASARLGTAIVHFGAPMRFVEYAFDGEAGSVRVALFAPAERRPVPPRAATDEYRVGTLRVRSRTDWGCPDGQSSRWTPAYSRVTHLVVHHTAGSNTLADWEAEVRNIWYYHTITNGWGDIGYNFLIDPNGVVYEGRAGGDGAIGAHFSCRNTNTAGIALLGSFGSEAPTAAATESLKALLTELSRRHGLRPDAIVRHVPTGLDVPPIIGHRDGNSSSLTCTRTVCPGDVLYALLPLLRSEIAAALVPPPRRRAVGAAAGSAGISVQR